MHPQSLSDCLKDLEAAGHLVRVKDEIDPNLELAEVQRRAYAQKAPALLFERVRGTPFPCVSNLFGTHERAAYIFRQTLDLVCAAVRMKANPGRFLREFAPEFLKDPLLYARLPFAGLWSLPKVVTSDRAPVMAHSTTIAQLPQIKCWPMDGGAFVTLPQVLSQDVDKPSIMGTNLGMYRVQLSGNQYIQDQEIGLHYQIHRGIGVHHTKALAKGLPMRVSVFVGGHPAHSVAAVMPLPEGLSELVFAGMLAGRRFRYAIQDGHIISADADFCIVGTVEGTKAEGPFGDHLGYYSLRHDFPLLKVEKVYHRVGAIWPLTVVGRPPQEDSTFGELIHDITGPMVPVSLPGVSALHAVDAAGVHPLLLALGTERYTPYDQKDRGAARVHRPQELLTQAHAILGFNQCSLAKYLLIMNQADVVGLNIADVGDFLKNFLQRLDLTNDLHFHTRTTIDTLDYSGEGLNQGSKLVMAAVGPPRRTLTTKISEAWNLPPGYSQILVAFPGVLVIQGPSYKDGYDDIARLVDALEKFETGGVIWIVVADDSEFSARNLGNFLWVTFTRSNPSHDCHGVRSFTEFKHWGCRGPLVIDARLKPHHAPPLIEDPEVSRRVDSLCAKGRSLHGIVS